MFPGKSSENASPKTTKSSGKKKRETKIVKGRKPILSERVRFTWRESPQPTTKGYGKIAKKKSASK